jgi:dihydroorotase
MMEFITPLVKEGGCDTIFVMPNLQPPITKVADALAYHDKLSHLAPGVRFLMSLYLHPDLDAATIAEAARTKIIHGVNPHIPITMLYSLL